MFAIATTGDKKSDKNKAQGLIVSFTEYRPIRCTLKMIEIRIGFWSIL